MNKRLSEKLRKLEDESRWEAILWRIKNPDMFWVYMRREDYRKRLRKALKNERYIDNDYFSWWVTSNLVRTLKESIEIIEKNVILQVDITKLKDAIDERLLLEDTRRYTKEEDFRQQKARKTICNELKTKGWYLWR